MWGARRGRRPIALHLRRPKAEPRMNHHTRYSEERGRNRTRLFERKPKESLNGEPLGAGLQTIYTTLHEGCMRLSVGLWTVHDIIVELGARLYDVRGGSAHSHAGPGNNSRPSLHSNKEAILTMKESMLCVGCPLQKCRTFSRI